MAVYLDDFFIRLMKEIWILFVKIDIFSATISSGGTHCDLRYQTLFDPVSKINSRSWVDQFSNMMGYFGEFFQDLCGIPIESH